MEINSHASARMDISTLWWSSDEAEWKDAYGRYWDYVKPANKDLEIELNGLKPAEIESMSPDEFYAFLRGKYFKWKYTAPNRYATTTVQLKKYEDGGMAELYAIKAELFSFDRSDIEAGLRIAKRIHGLGVAGASGLLALLFPSRFGTADQFVVKALRTVPGLPDKALVEKMKPEGLTVADGVVLIRIFREKAAELNRHFGADDWTPRKIDMVLWTYGRE